MLLEGDSQARSRIARELRRAFFLPHVQSVLDRVQFEAALPAPAGWDLVLTEHELGWSDGFEVLRAVKARSPDCPVIMCTASDSARLAVRALKAGFDDFVLKTGEQLAQLPRIARTALDRARERSEGRGREYTYRNLFQDLPLGLYRTALDGRFLDANPAMLQVVGYDGGDELLQANLLEMYADEDERRAWLEQLQRDGVSRGREMKLRRRDGALIWVENNAAAVFDRDNRLCCYQGSLENISERKWTEQRLQILAHYDVLTGLPNRLLFRERLQEAIQEAGGTDRLVGVAFFDIDRFKYVNDSLGHETGDLVLKAVAARFAASTWEENTLARLSGDEFGVVLRGLARVDDVTRVAEQIIAIFSQPFYVSGRELFLTPSVGLTVFPFDGGEAEGLMQNAEVAMYGAKSRGGNCYHYYSADMADTVSQHLALEHALRRAVDRNQFLLHYQPQVQVDTGRIVGAEALLRWPDAPIPPSEFIPMAEETGMIVAMGQFALREACRQNKAWQEAGLPALRVAVNVSARHFQQPGLPQTVARVLKETGLDPEHLELEITESVLVQNTEANIATLKELSAMGVHLSIDDFGTGYSSLSYLTRFPIDALKIDQSFVQDLTKDPDKAAVANAIIVLAHSLGMRVIAEGVETEEQLAFVRDRGGEIIQGNFFSEPLPPQGLARLLEERREPVAGGRALPGA